MARDLAKHRIRVNAVCPGMVFTPFYKQQRLAAAEADPKLLEVSDEDYFNDKAERLIPLGHGQKPEDIARAVCFPGERPGRVDHRAIAQRRRRLGGCHEIVPKLRRSQLDRNPASARLRSRIPPPERRLQRCQSWALPRWTAPCAPPQKRSTSGPSSRLPSAPKFCAVRATCSRPAATKSHETSRPKVGVPPRRRAARLRSR